jgi:hypothetical protein
MEKILPLIGDVVLDPSDPGLRLPPVPAVFDFPAQPPLRFGQPSFVLPVDIARLDDGPVADRGERAIPISIPTLLWDGYRLSHSAPSGWR